MDAIEILRNDQKSLRAQLDQVLDAASDEEQNACFREFRATLNAFQRAEQAVFYPSFNHDPAFESLLEKAALLHRGLSKRAESIHQMIEKDETILLRAELSAMSHLLSELIELDQSEIFPLAHRTLSRGLRERLGRHLEAEKHDSSQTLSAA
jgi:hypothetical protein